MVLSSIKEFKHTVYDKCQIAWDKKIEKNNSTILKKKFLLDVPSISIDYAVIEKAKSIGLIEFNVGWQDIGSWDVLSDTLMQNGYHNNDGNIMIKSSNNFILSDDLKVTTIGINDLIVVKSKKNLLIMKKGFSQFVKEIPENIR